ncbi:MAG TPA: Uma2 family endonuclease [Bryobacteraceae bacterium]|jgi:Uma2 family endonuclease
MATVPASYVSPEEYLERERKAETKSEYIRGEIFAMAGASIRHGRIVSNLVRELGNRLTDGPCEVFATDLRLAVDPSAMYTYPDVMVVCGDPIVIDKHKDTITNPIVILEVLSDSTKNYDRGQKFQCYRTLSSLKDYLTIAQDEMRVERWTRQQNGQWLLTEFDRTSGAIELQSVAVTLEIVDIYRRVDFTTQ